MRLHLLEGLLVSLLFGGFLVLWRHKNRTVRKSAGVEPEVILGDTRPTQRYFARLLQVLTLGLVGMIIFHALGLDERFSLLRLHMVDRWGFDLLGLIVGTGGLWLCAVAQKEMGNAWRVGIDRHGETDLVTTGVYSRIRNPTYSGLFLVCSGTFLIFPTCAVLAWILLFFVSLEFQVRLEEEFLAQRHGEIYLRYFQSTTRYIPHIY